MAEKIQELISQLSEYEPEAYAKIKGSNKYPNIEGTVVFYPLWRGTLVFVTVTGIPYSDKACSDNICAFHIHEGNSCSGTTDMPFANAGVHYNPLNCPHPAHAGDLPPLFSAHGFAMQMVYTERFTPKEIINRTVIIHLKQDDFTTQPSGNAGEMIACGVIKEQYNTASIS